jgi:uncharacterized protein YceH (UPF0502 family)
MEREPPLVSVLPRQPGTKESRYGHLLSGEVEAWAAPSKPDSVKDLRSDAERISRLESEIMDLQNRVTDLQQQFVQFRKQFD